MELNNRTVMFVDDDKQVINALKRSMMEMPYSVLYAESGREALDMFNARPIDLVISDMVMPNMDGYEFLKIVAKKYPETIRVILSAFAESENVKKCLVEGVVENFLPKPWNDNDLKESIENALSLQDDLADKDIMNLMAKIQRFPVLPVIYYDVSQAIKAGKNARIISNVIEKDAAFAADVMKVSNSAFYFHGRRTKSVMSAIVFLGMRTLQTIMLNISLFKSLDRSVASEAKLLWDHSALCNEFMFYLYKRFTYRELPEDFHSAGLLHDIGKFFIMNALPDKYIEIIKIMKKNPDLTWSEAEMDIMDIPHSKLGNFLLKKWNFIHKLPLIVLYHHDPLNAPMTNEDRHIMAVLFIADILSWNILYNDNDIVILKEILEYINKKPEEIEKVFNIFKENRERRMIFNKPRRL